MMKLMTVARRCPFCQNVTSVAVDAEGYLLWTQGVLIQVALPSASDSERETLMSGLCLKCQAEFFEDEGEE